MKFTFLIPLLLLVLVLPVSAAVNFVASPNTGVAPLTVHFTDQSDVASTWRWNFGDGDVQSINGGSGSTSHTYSNPGTYTVSMTVNGASTVSYPIIVTAPTPVPTTIPTTSPTTVPTTIPTTEPTTLPTTEVTTVQPTTAQTTEPTTVQTTVLTTVPTTVPTTEIPTTEQTTTITTTIPTTVETTVPTTIPTTIIPTTTSTTVITTEILTTIPTTQLYGSPTITQEPEELTPSTPEPTPPAVQGNNVEPQEPYEDKSLEFTLPYLKDESGKPISIKIYVGDLIYIIRRS